MNKVNSSTSPAIITDTNNQDTSLAHDEMLYWAKSYLHMSNIRRRKTMTPENKVDFVALAYSYYAVKLLKEYNSPSISQCQSMLEDLADIAQQHQSSMQVFIFDDNGKKFAIENRAEYPISSHLLQGPYFFYNKKEYEDPNNRFHARYSASVSDDGFKPLVELIVVAQTLPDSSPEN